MSKKILIVEDEILIADCLKTVLSDYGYDVVGIASTADDAVLKARELHPDLIIMDYILKENKTGTSVCNEVWEFCDVPVIFTSAYNEEYIISQLENKDKPFVFLDKSVGLSEFVRYIDEFLKNNKK